MTTGHYILEVMDSPVGLLVEDENGFIFHASDAEVGALNHQPFPSVMAANRAVRTLLAERHQAAARRAGRGA